MTTHRNIQVAALLDYATQVLRNVIAGIPESHFDLNVVQETMAGRPVEADENIGPCGSVGCIAGWAWLYPPFIEQGIRNVSKSENRIDAASKFFDLHTGTFCGAGYASSHKAIALRRLDALLK